MNTTNFSIEQQFALISFNQQVDLMSLQQAQDILKDLYCHHMAYKLYTEQLLKHNWNLEQVADVINQRPTESQG